MEENSREKSWNTNDIDFDAEGRLVIKNADLIRIIGQELDQRRELTVYTMPSPYPDPRIPGGPTFPPPVPTPNMMCECTIRRDFPQ